MPLQLIGAILRSNRTLKTLILRYNAIGNLGAFELVGALKVNPTLTALDVRDNGRIQPQTAKKLGQLVGSLLV